MASSILTLPTEEVIKRLSNRFKEVDPSAVHNVLLFMRTANELSSELETFLAPFELSTGRFSTLMVLYRDPSHPMNQAVIAQSLKVKPATMTGLIDGLEKQGFVLRGTDPTDRRNSPIKITTAGIKHLEKIIPDYFSRMSSLMKGISQKDRTTYLQITEKMRENIAKRT